MSTTSNKQQRIHLFCACEQKHEFAFVNMLVKVQQEERKKEYKQTRRE